MSWCYNLVLSIKKKGRGKRVERFILIFLVANIIATITNVLISVRMIKENKSTTVYLNSGTSNDLAMELNRKGVIK